MKSYNEKLRNPKISKPLNAKLGKPIINKPSNKEMGNSTKISKPRV